MRFLADMGISPRTIIFLQDLGYDALHLHDPGNPHHLTWPPPPAEQLQPPQSQAPHCWNVPGAGHSRIHPEPPSSVV